MSYDKCLMLFYFKQHNMKSLSTLVPTQFVTLAQGLGVTPEYLLSLAAIKMLTENPGVLRIVSASPLGEQSCGSCQLRALCSSKAQKEQLICFETLAPFSTVV